MKSVEKYIYIVIIVILVGVIASGVTYIVMSNNKDNNTQENQTNTTNSNTNTDTKDTIKLSESEIKEYLSYIPNDLDNKSRSVYSKPNNVNNFEKNNLLGVTIYYAGENTKLGTLSVTGDELIYKKEDIDNLMYKLFNTTSGIIENSNNPIAGYNLESYYFNNGQFKVSGGGGNIYDSENISLLDKYEVTSDNLIIYEYAALFNELNTTSTLKDYNTNNEITIENSDILVKTVELAQKYLESNKEQFTKYKHTFKKNDTGYYWYSTEVVK